MIKSSRYSSALLARSQDFSYSLNIDSLWGNDPSDAMIIDDEQTDFDDDDDDNDDDESSDTLNGKRPFDIDVRQSRIII